MTARERAKLRRQAWEFVIGEVYCHRFAKREWKRVQLLALRALRRARKEDVGR